VAGCAGGRAAGRRGFSGVWPTATNSRTPAGRAGFSEPAGMVPFRCRRPFHQADFFISPAAGRRLLLHPCMPAAPACPRGAAPPLPLPPRRRSGGGEPGSAVKHLPPPRRVGWRCWWVMSPRMPPVEEVPHASCDGSPRMGVDAHKASLLLYNFALLAAAAGAAAACCCSLLHGKSMYSRGKSRQVPYRYQAVRLL
jgi:hypothetical protein